MLLFKFCVFLAILATLVRSLLNLRLDRSARNILVAIASAALFAFGLYMMAHALFL